MRINPICIGMQLIVLAFFGANIYQSNAGLNGETSALEYFFFRDVKFTNTIARVWGNWTWNKSIENGGFFDGYSRFRSSGGADLSYNETGDKGWGGAMFLQGTHPHTFRESILGGANRQSVVLKEYISFKRTDEIPENEFILSSKVMVHERNYTDFGDSVEAVSNVGIDLMFGYDDADYHDSDWNHPAAIHADVILSRVWWDNETKALHHNEIGESSVAPFGYDADYHLPLIRGKIETLGVWSTFEIDLAEIVETIFVLLEDVNTIHFRGVQVYIDGKSSYAKATYSWVLTKIRSEIFKPVFQRGMSYATYANMSSPDQYASTLSDESLRRMKSTGVDWVAINVIWYQENLTTTHIYPNMSAYSPTNESLVHAIERCHELEMKVMLKPMIDCENGSWRGDITPIPGWFENYTYFISFFAELAEQHNVEMFCIGCELKNTASDEQSWRNVIESVEAKYAGPITYASTWGMYEWIEWWDALDYIGINAWFNLTQQYDPTLLELKQACTSHLEEIETWWLDLNETVQKPVIFTEIGYQSVNGTNREPWNYWLMYSNNLDLQEQTECYEAVFQSVWNKNWLNGMYWWYWQTNPDAGGSNNTDYTPQNKPAQGVIAHWYSFLTTINDMQKQIDSLNSDCENLALEQEAIMNELSNIRNLMYAFIATTAILIISTVYLGTKTRVAKSKT